jgi:hypothetical protein
MEGIGTTEHYCSVVPFHSYHFPVIFQVFGNTFKEVKLLHHLFELCQLLVDFSMQQSLFTHILQPCLWLKAHVGGSLSLFVGYPSDQSVIEEKGEGFENGKILLARLDLPSTSIALHVIRLKILYTYKHYALQITTNTRSTYSQNAFQNVLLRNIQLLRQPHF